jgi:3-methyladenine DNA glycosylase AlkD
MILDSLRKELKVNVDLEYKKGAENFFKEPILVYGVRTPVFRKIARKYFKEVKELSKKEIFNLINELYKTNYHEEFIIGTQWLYAIKEQFEAKDFNQFEKWLSNYVNNWAKCDDYCTHPFGYLITKFPELIPKIYNWTKSNNRWMRRASAVILIHPVARKQCLQEVFKAAKILLLDNDDLVQKGYGWSLKVAADSYQKEVFDFVMKHKHNMPRTALRYAIEKMPKDLKQKAMQR